MTAARSIPVDVPDEFSASYRADNASGRSWIAGLPELAASFLDRWALRPDGPTGHGVASLGPPVTRVDGTPAPEGLRRPADIAAAMLGQALHALPCHQPPLSAWTALSSIAGRAEDAGPGGENFSPSGGTSQR
ncbi:hypothetical protein [Streptomyces sp. 2A115]|uniref:hypothetical protein n=1 Tax=Streptomyces sp. 2A115 TaxID=3457439 RepID=UPI003FD460A7